MSLDNAPNNFNSPKIEEATQKLPVDEVSLSIHFKDENTKEKISLIGASFILLIYGIPILVVVYTILVTLK